MSSTPSAELVQGTRRASGRAVACGEPGDLCTRRALNTVLTGRALKMRVAQPLFPAGTLPFKSIIHVAGINMFWRSSERSIRDSVRNAMTLAIKRGYRSTAIPLVDDTAAAALFCKHLHARRAWQGAGRRQSCGTVDAERVVRNNGRCASANGLTGKANSIRVSMTGVSLSNCFCVVVPRAKGQTSWASGQINTRPHGSHCSHSRAGAGDHRRPLIWPCPSGEQGPPDCPEDGSVE